MSRYFTQLPAPPRSYFDDEYPDQIHIANVTVSDHQPVDTGLVDIRGRAIMRACNPIGFGRDGEW